MKRFTPFTLQPARKRPRRLESGQALIIIAFTFVAIAAFVGLALDLGIFLVAQAHLRRGIDSAAIAAASQMREGTPFLKISEFTAQFIRMNSIDVNTVKVSRCQTIVDPVTGVQTRSIDQAFITAGTVTTTVHLSGSAEFQKLQDLCTTPPRKLIRVDAAMDVRFSFLPIIGFYGTTATANATSEAAAIDLVIVIGTSETMGQSTEPTNAFGLYVNYSNFDPDIHCNPSAGPEVAKKPNDPQAVLDAFGVETYPAKCRPLWDAKQAAKVLLRTLYNGYDRVAVVGYDFRAIYYQDPAPPNPVLTLNIGTDATASSPSTGAYAMIDSLVLKDDPNDVPPPNEIGTFSPLNIDCRFSIDPEASECRNPDPERSAMSSCPGCGIRVAANILRQYGRTEALWAVIFLSDGFANMSDLPDAVFASSALPTAGNVLLETRIPELNYPGDAQANKNGFCQGKSLDAGAAGRPQNGLWSIPQCVWHSDINGDGSAANQSPYFEPEAVQNTLVRFCGPFRDGAADCPPGSYFVGEAGYTTTTSAITLPVRISGVATSVNVPANTNLFYNVYDYALDQVDFAALTRIPAGLNELPRGSNIAIYGVGLGQTVIWTGNDAAGERMLRYMAAVGDDGDRATDVCAGVPIGISCGNYYYAPDPSGLAPVFEDIARRIFTRLAR